MFGLKVYDFQNSSRQIRYLNMYKIIFRFISNFYLKLPVQTKKGKDLGVVATWRTELCPKA